MNTTILSSTFLLTLLLAVGLFFFIRASVKDRTQKVKLIAQQPEEVLLGQLREYFDQRSYRVAQVDAAANQVTFEGFVRPSWFLAIFLTLLAGSGILCLSLVLCFLFPQLTSIFLGLPIFAPAAGIFYWQKAGRPEQVSFKLETLPNANSLITIAAHRDELASLRQALGLRETEE